MDGYSWVLGDNQAVINSTTITHSSLSKHWNAVSYHWCHEAVAAGICHFKHIPSSQNQAKACAFIKPILLWKGKSISGTTHQRGATG